MVPTTTILTNWRNNMRSTDEELFCTLMDKSGSVLMIDNDRCYVKCPSQHHEDEDDHMSFDFGYIDLIRIMSSKLNWKSERV
jgi:hypothetical protein